MENIKPTTKSATFLTGIKSLFDRKIGGINLLTNDQILAEKMKLENMRNGKVRP